MADGWKWAVAAGSNAAGAAVAAKLGGVISDGNVFRIASYAAVLLCNIIMWSCYTRSLQTLSSLQATVLNFAANFLLSGLAGHFMFGEELQTQWFIGACCIVLGIWVLSKAEMRKHD